MHDLAHPKTAPHPAVLLPQGNFIRLLGSLMEAGTCTFKAHHCRRHGCDHIDISFPGDGTVIILGIQKDGRIHVWMPRFMAFDEGLYVYDEAMLGIDKSGLFRAQCKAFGAHPKDFFWGISLQLTPEVVPLVTHCIDVAWQIAKGSSIDVFPEMNIVLHQPEGERS